MSIFDTEDRQPDEFAERAYSYRAWDWKDQAGVVARYDELRGCVMSEIEGMQSVIDEMSRQQITDVNEIEGLRATIERSDIHAESSRIYALLASTIRAGASDEQVGRIARGLHKERTTKESK